MGKRNEGSGDRLFSGLTVDEADVLRAKLGSGATTARLVNGHGSHDLFMETHAVLADVSEARRQRWNSEHPDFQMGE